MLKCFILVSVFLLAAPVAALAQTAYDIEQLHPDVRVVVLAAREAQEPAENAAARAREAAAQGEDAAARARVGEEGYRAHAREGDPDRRSYEGQWRSGRSQGVGVLTFGAGRFEGDRYAGGFSCGHKHGFGVYSYAHERNDRVETRYEGGYDNGRWSGSGIYYARDGARYAGEVAAEGMSGVGVHVSANGWRYEGQFANNRPNGLGVLWDARGRVRRVGIFENARLVLRLNANSPSPEMLSTVKDKPSDARTCAAAMVEDVEP
ncbi:MAG: hypothetical protein ABL889_09030 [Terricaulis sp.]